jgi:hypothetical protein
VVTESEGDYAFQGIAGTSPTLELVRGELHYFDVSALPTNKSFALRLSSGGLTAVPGASNNNTTVGRDGSSADTVIAYDVPLDAPLSIIYQSADDLLVFGAIDLIDKIGPVGATGPTGSQGVAGADGEDVSSVVVNTSFTSTWTGTDLTFTGTPVDASYARAGAIVSFRIRVFFTNVTNVGTGQYQLTLPFSPTGSQTAVFTGAVIDDDGENVIFGRAEEGSPFVTLWYGGTNGAFTALTGAAPLALDTSTVLYISGTYITTD